MGQNFLNLLNVAFNILENYPRNYMELHTDIYLIRFHSVYKYINRCSFVMILYLGYQMLSYLLWSCFIFITGDFSYCPIIIGILPTEKMCLSHYAKCMVSTISYIMVCYMIYLIKYENKG